MKFFNLEKKNINFLKKLYTNYPIVFVFLLNKDLVVKISNQDLKNFLFFLKHHTECLFSQLIDLSMIDYVEKKNRFEVFYNLLSLKYNMRLVVSSNLTELTTLESVSQIYPSAQWYEREAWDMFGVFFTNNSDFRRILTDYGFKGHPLRKDFPLTGYVEVRYDDFTKRIVYEKVSLAQQYRIFTLESSWENSQRI